MKYIFKKQSKAAVEPHASSYTSHVLVLCAVVGICDAGVVLPPRGSLVSCCPGRIGFVVVRYAGVG